MELWIEIIEITSLRLLNGLPPHHAVYHYAEYLVAMGWWDNVDFFVSLFARAVSDPGILDGIEMITKALGTARAALSSLCEAERRTYSWYTPEDRCAEQVRAQIRWAIQAIESAESEG